MGANSPSGTRAMGATRHQNAATYLRWMQFDVDYSTGPIARRIGWRATMKCNFNVVKSKMASSPYPAAEDDRAFLTKEGFGPIFFLGSAASRNLCQRVFKKACWHVADVARCTERGICDCRVLHKMVSQPSTSDSEDEHAFLQYKLVILGDGAVGKTSLSLRFSEDRFSRRYSDHCSYLLVCPALPMAMPFVEA